MISRWRVAVLSVLGAGPILFLVGLGGYYLLQTPWAIPAGWLMTASLAAAYILGWYWQRQKKLLPPVDFTVSPHWTDRDKQAWQLVEARAKAAAQLDPEKLGTVQFYVDSAQEMALELARFYHPKSKDPIGYLTLPEILAVIELASHDLAEMTNQYIPGGHLLTINDWRRAKQATEWYQTASNVYWMVSALVAPVNTAMRYLAAQAGMAQPWKMLQQNLIAWFYTAYVHRLGTYLIDLYSGRLRVGATRYRELVQGLARDGQAAPPGVDAADRVRQVTITVLGQVKAGKSSAINALLGEQRVRTDVLPATEEVTRYELHLEGIPTRLVLLDTVGYAHTGPRQDQLRATQQAAHQSDLVLLVLHARNPARQADVDLLQKLRAWFASRPDLKMPPVLGVLTHIDLLSPAMEWAPPYNWQQPQRAKEHQIQQAVAAARGQLGDFVVDLVPVCTAPGKVYGVEEGLLPAMTRLLDEAQAVGLLRCLRAEVDAGKVRKVLSQLLAAGSQAAKVVWQNLPK